MFPHIQFDRERAPNGCLE